MSDEFDGKWGRGFRCGRERGHMNTECECGHGRWDHIGEDDSTACAWVEHGPCMCEAFTAAVQPDERDALVKVLGDHRLLFLDEWADKCSCGWFNPDADSNETYLAVHRAHVADELLKAGYHR